MSIKTKKIDERFKLDNSSFQTSYLCLRLLKANAQFIGNDYVNNFLNMLSDDLQQASFSDLLVLHNKIGELGTTVNALNEHYNFSSWKMFSVLCYSICTNIIIKQLDVNKETWQDVEKGLAYMNS